MARQGREVPSSINLEEINRTSLHSPQWVTHHESNIEPLLQEVYPKYFETNPIQESFQK